MSNWYENLITIKTETEEEMTTVLAAVAGRHDPFDFQKILPMPAVLKHLGFSDSGCFDFHVDERILTVHHWFERHGDDGELIERRPFTPAELMKYENQPYRIDLDWMLDNWGCGGSATSIKIERSKNEAFISFETIEGPPKGILNTLRTRFPEASITADFAIFEWRGVGSC
ncbi:MAG: hypothetical protein ACU0A8_07535 [Limimaricola soesokkakensis]|uniref:hypothetical protein n=1 Tax=Limimaricola soesokkakensis TaxID=1343159 RepID=UPI004059912F